MSSDSEAPIRIDNLTMAYGPRVLMHDLDFDIPAGRVFIIMGGSGCGKSTLMRHMIGLKSPAKGRVLVHGESYWEVPEQRQDAIKRRFGVMFQQGALYSSMTLAENVALPMEVHTALPAAEIRDVAAFKLALVGLAGTDGLFPAEISGGMRKRAAIARAMALDPEVLFLDEPSAGLDPITSRRLDELIIELCRSLGTTFVVVTHELQSIFAIGDDGIFLDVETKTAAARGSPAQMLASGNPRVEAFLTRDHTVDPAQELSRAAPGETP